jgi:NAD(P)H dehydrogenase (quinone)
MGHSMIVVTGATGKLGRLVVNGLLAKLSPTDVAIAVRDPQKAAEFAARGVSVRRADYNEPTSLEQAFAGADTVMLISSNEVGRRVAQHEAVIEAAHKRGVKLLAYTSLLRADTSGLAIAEEHRQTEKAIRASGIPFVFLRNGWYIENHTDQIPTILQHNAIVGAAGEGRFASATRQDYADAAVAVLTNGGQENTVHELAGDGAFTLSEFAAELSKQTDRTITYNNLPPEEYKGVLAGAGLPEPFVNVLVDSDVQASRGALHGSSADFRRLIGRPTTPLSAAIAAARRI